MRRIRWNANLRSKPREPNGSNAAKARSSLSRGDHFGTVRFLKLSFERTGDCDIPEPYAMLIRERADPEFAEMLDRAGIPRYDMTDDEMKPPPRSAGLALSVGQASLAVRVFLALVFLAAALLCAAAGVLVARAGHLPLIVAVLLIEPIGIAGVIAAVFISAPQSSIGVRIDELAARLSEPRIALFAASSIWLLSLLIIIGSDARM